jgi:hypothetical protein
MLEKTSLRKLFVKAILGSSMIKYHHGKMQTQKVEDNSIFEILLRKIDFIKK